MAQKCHGNFNFITAISISPRQFQLRSRQFQFHHGNFNFVHGNFNFTTAISTSFTAISTLSRQFQFCHGNLNFVHGNFNFNFTAGISASFTAISTLNSSFPLPRSQGLSGMTLRKGPESQIDHAERLKMAEDERMLLESLFYKGYEYEEILYMLKNQHNITISLSTLKGS